MRNGLALIVLLAGLLSACLPEPPPEATASPTLTPTLTPTATATIIWFPATATYTPFATQIIEPTQDMRPVVGPLLLEDDYSDKTQWTTSRSSAGNVAYGNGELTLAVSQPGGMLISLRKSPELRNFYLEIDALPSLCRGGDAYGLLIRAASTQDFYRVLANCSAQLRVERVKNGKVALLQDWLPSGQIQPGGMLRSRLGVSAAGNEMRVFVNGIYQFSFKDPVLESGVVGVIARAAGDSPLTVSFSNLRVYSNIVASAPLAAATATPQPSPTRRTPPSTPKPGAP